MPPTYLFDLSEIDMTKRVFDQKDILEVNPQSFEMQQLDGIIWHNLEKLQILGYKDVTENEFWVRGHIPGRPLFPGALMIETAAQLVSVYAKSATPGAGFVGFGGVGLIRDRNFGPHTPHLPDQPPPKPQKSPRRVSSPPGSILDRLFPSAPLLKPPGAFLARLYAFTVAAELNSRPKRVKTRCRGALHIKGTSARRFWRVGPLQPRRNLLFTSLAM